MNCTINHIINIIIANRDIQKIKYIINNIINNIDDIQIKTFIVTNECEIVNIMEQTKIHILLSDYDIINSNIINSIPFIIKTDESIDTNELNEKIFLCKNYNIVNLITNQLLTLGYSFKLKGTRYLLDTILYIYEKNDFSLLDNLEQNVYTQIAIKYNKSVSNIKTNLIKSTTYVYMYQDKNVLEKYFSINIKITPKLVITTILNNICKQS